MVFSTQAIDDRLARYMLDTSPENELALIATGESGLDRLLDIAFGRSSLPFHWPDLGPGYDQRASGEIFSSALHLLGATHPKAYMDRIGRIKVLDIVSIAPTLADVDDPRATAMLLSHVRDEDFISRYNVVVALGRKDEEAAHEALEAALGDPDRVVRLAAILGVGRRNPKRALELLGKWLAEGPQPPPRDDVIVALQRDFETRAGDEG